MLCKTIILSNSQNLNNNSPKGILTLSKEGNSVLGKIRLYNISQLPLTTKIGIYVNENVHISSITKKTHHYEFQLNENIDITQSIVWVWNFTRTSSATKFNQSILLSDLRFFFQCVNNKWMIVKD